MICEMYCEKGKYKWIWIWKSFNISSGR